MKKVVVLGAGYSGVLTAKKLAKKLRGQATITIIDKKPYHTMLTELHEVAANRVDEDSIKMELKEIFAHRDVRVVLDRIINFDVDNKVLEGEASSYEYDILVLAAGSKPTFFGVEGASEHSHTLWSFEDAVNLREHIHSKFCQAACETDHEKKKRMLTFYVVGAGFTGVEMIGELAEYAPILCRKYRIAPEDVTLVNVDFLSRAVPILPESLSAKVENRLRKMGVSLQFGVSVVGIGEDFIRIKDGERIDEYATDTVIWAAGIEGSDITADVSNKLASKGRGRIEVDPFLRSIDKEDVFVVGDNMFYIPEGEELPVPQMVENCEHSAATAAKNIAVALTGPGEMEKYAPKFHGIMVSVGGRYAVARGGFPNRMFNLPSFFAMLAKHFINLVYFLQVMGWTKIFNYLKHEFFTIRNRRSILGGHFSNVTPSFMMVPLRVWLGCVWLFEGVHKAMDGWLETPKLVDFFGGANRWYQSILDPESLDAMSSATTDAASSASTAVTGTAEAVGTAIINWDIWGLFKLYLVSGKELAESALSDFAVRVDIPLMNSFLDEFVMNSDAMMLFMQRFIVVMEILIGLALIAGLFNFLASGMSIVLQMMFITTTGLYLHTVWMLFAGIAVLIAGGQTLGLDYYVMPVLKKKWQKVPFARKWYLYHD